MTDIAAAIGLVQLERLEEFTKTRIQNAGKLTAVIKKKSGLTPPFLLSQTRHVFHQYTIRVTRKFHLSREGVMDKLAKDGVGTGIYYPLPLHKQPIYKKQRGLVLENAEFASAEVLSLPVHPGLSKEELGHVLESLKGL